MSIDRDWYARVEKRRFKIKDIDSLKSLDDVFNEYTLQALYKLMAKGVVYEIHGPVAQGKEAKVFWGEDRNGNDLAIKIFYTTTTQFIRGRYRYVIGDYRFENRKISNTFKLIEVWCRKEFSNLKIVYEVGVRVPKPISFYKNILVMEFINYMNERGVPAPLIKDEPPEDPWNAYLTILNYIERYFILGKIVHADLSEYNIVNTGQELVIIDWGSAVKASHPDALEFLHRDIVNISKYFEKELEIEVFNPDTVFKLIVERANRFKEICDEELKEPCGEKDGWLIIDGKTLLEELEQPESEEIKES